MVVRTIDRERLDGLIGTLGPRRIRQLIEGLALVFGCDELADAERRW